MTIPAFVQLTDLKSQLRALALGKHSDHTIGDDAAQRIEQLERQVSALLAARSVAQPIPPLTDTEVLEATIAMLAGLRKYAIVYAPDGTTRCWQAFWRDGEKLGIRSDSYRDVVAHAEQLERLS